MKPGHPGLPRAVVYGLLRALPGEPSSVATVARKELAPHELGASVGRQNDTTSPSVSAALVGRSHYVHRIPPHVRDDRDPPLASGETGGDTPLICPHRARGLFSSDGLDSKSADLPVGLAQCFWLGPGQANLFEISWEISLARHRLGPSKSCVGTCQTAPGSTNSARTVRIYGGDRDDESPSRPAEPLI